MSVCICRKQFYLINLISLFQSNVIQEKLLGIVYKSSNETPLQKIVFPYKVKFKGWG